MTEPLFGSTAPMWTAMPTPAFGYQTPMAVGNGPLAPLLFSPRTLPLATGMTTGAGGGSPTVAGPALSTPAGVQPYAPGMAAPLFSWQADPSTGLVGVRGEAIGGMVATTSLVAAVAMRRGQPQGPANDQDVEDFVHDALDLVAGAGDVDARCEGGRVTLTGTVPHRRIKRDVGEIVWAIPAVHDVQNNVAIASRRRGRPATSREAETPPGVAARKQG